LWKNCPKWNPAHFWQHRITFGVKSSPKTLGRSCNFHNATQITQSPNWQLGQLRPWGQTLKPPWPKPPSGCRAQRMRKRTGLSGQDAVQSAAELHLQHGAAHRRLQLLVRRHQEEVHLLRRVRGRAAHRWRWDQRQVF
jgi:hypothetical protein